MTRDVTKKMSKGSAKKYLPLLEFGKSIAILKHFSLSSISFLPTFYLNYTYYFGLLIFCCQIVATNIILNSFHRYCQG